MTLSVSQDVVMSEDIITEYATGTLSPAKHIIVACQSEIAEAVAERVAFQEEVAASFIEEADGQSLSPLFMGNVLANLPQQESANENAAPKGGSRRNLCVIYWVTALKS
jgi:anti-sigma factor ChrR (cupin superfamily)